MLDIQEVANLISGELNRISGLQGQTYSFDILSENGENSSGNSIFGIIKTTGDNVKPIPNYVEVKYDYIVELNTPSARTNKNILAIKKIVGQFVKENNGKNKVFTTGKGDFSCNLLKPKDYKISYGTGESVPMYLDIHIAYTENGVTSGQKHWLLNDVEIPFESERVDLQKEGRTNAINGKNYTETLMTKQTKVYSFTIPYDTTNNLCVMLNQDLFNGDYDKTYTLKFYDGVSFTQQAPYTSVVSIYSPTSANSRRLEASTFNIVFTDADNGSGTQYYMALIDNPFGDNNENTRWFENQSVQQAYYETKILTGCNYDRIKAPNLNSLDITSQVYPNTRGYDIFDLVNKNYAIIKVINGDSTRYFYYKTGGGEISSKEQVIFNLRLDTLQTYYFDPNLNFEMCLIERAHLNRFEEDANNPLYVNFKSGEDSLLYAREDITNMAKRMTKRSRINLYNEVGNLAVSNWLNENILGWLYAYVDKNHEFRTQTVDSDVMLNNTKFHETQYMHYVDNRYEAIYSGDKRNYSIPNNMAVLCVPLFKDKNHTIKVTADGVTREYVVDGTSFEAFFNENTTTGAQNSMAYCYAYKFSTTPPFNVGDYVNSNLWSVSQDGYTLLLNTYTYYDEQISFNGGLAMYPIANSQGVFNISVQDPYYISSYRIGDLFNKTFTKQIITNSARNPIFNPKLNSIDYKALRVTNQNEDGFDYDLQKLNLKDLDIRITEPLLPDITKQYVRIKTNANDNPVYIPECSQNLTGAVMQNDTSLTILTSAYQNMIANNKNYFQQNAISRETAYENQKTGQLVSGANALVSAGGAIASGDISQMFGSAVGLFGAGIGAIGQEDIANRNYNASVMQEKLTVDNMRNSPSSITKAQGSSIFTSVIGDAGIYIEEWQALPAELRQANDYMCKYGFAVNVFGNIREYDNVRHYYNYVQAQVDNISGIPLSNIARDNLKQRFAKGVRFWTSDNVNYLMENYENWLLN